MNKITVIIALLISASWMGVASDDSAPYEIQWDKSFGGDAYDEARGVVPTSDGGYLLVGYSQSFGQGYATPWAQKLDANGNQLWKKTYEGDLNNMATGVVAAKDGGYLVLGASRGNATSQCSYDKWVKKIDINGNMLWHQAYTRIAGDSVTDIIAIDSGYLLVGNTAYKVVGMRDMWAQKIDTDGNPIWDNAYGGNERDSAYSVIASPDGGYLIVGHKGFKDTKRKYAKSSDHNMWVQRIDKLGSPIWDKVFDGDYGSSSAHDVIAIGDGGYLVIGTKHYSYQSSKMWVLKIDDEGNLIWENKYGGGLLDDGTSAIATQDGGFLVAGKLEGDVWVQKIDAFGSLQWSKAYDNGAYDGASYIINSSDGGFLVVGHTAPKGGSKRDVWVLKLMPPKQ